MKSGAGPSGDAPRALPSRIAGAATYADDAVVMLTAHPGAGATVGDAFLASSSSSSSSSSGRPRRQRAVVAVGPEGGWTDFERRSLLDAGFVEVALGRRTFATDVACVALVAAVRECTSSW